MHKFQKLRENYSHTPQVHHSYNLNYGKGEINRVITRSIITSSDIFIEDLRSGSWFKNIIIKVGKNIFALINKLKTSFFVY